VANFDHPDIVIYKLHEDKTGRVLRRTPNRDGAACCAPTKRGGTAK
jgi:hypothetical protein